ncbi:uncharacterized protein LOC126687241 isoform X1 [Mercurialis annua]|uniref:uncharacterized protein LOC126687241 isoform X1 n=1 Tax=Mercurialis annua TaxID=3986 RepID=UPI00215FB2AD|nr:uncharacterized protein LOC126687241 isoform X1 [Mercurialis annua]
MGFTTVYRSLLELFPQVDARMLKAVAIEHPKDPDLAAEIVISEVLPYLARLSIAGPPIIDDCNKASGLSAGKAKYEGHSSSSNDQFGLGKTAGCSLESSLTYNESTSKTDCNDSGQLSDSTHQPNAYSSTEAVSLDSNIDANQLQGNIDSEELILLKRPRRPDNLQADTGHTSEFVSNALSPETITIQIEVPASLGKCQEDNIRVADLPTLQAMSSSLMQERHEFDGSLTGIQREWKDLDCPLLNDFDTCGKRKIVEPCIDGRETPQVEPCIDAVENPSHEPCLDSTNLEMENSAVERTPNTAEVDFHPEFSGTPTTSSENLKFNQEIKIDFLDDIVEAAKNNKKTLFLAVDSIMNMMRQVELKEKAVEEAKEEASCAGLDILAKVDELKQMLSHAKETNDMHAGEVYGERAILATEVRELQARLLNLADERDKALAIIDEMGRSLEERLAAAEESRKAAEKQKLEQEAAARVALVEQETIMDKVVQQSKILQEEADENAKLREFLMDRGRVVDTLQGEISVICQDVRLLKGKFDERVPLSMSISSSQTSCILASSGSSLKSIASDLVSDPREASNSPKERSPASSIYDQSLKSLQQISPSSSNRGSSPKIPELMRSPTSSMDGQPPKGGVQEMKMYHDSDDDWEFFG